MIKKASLIFLLFLCYGCCNMASSTQEISNADLSFAYHCLVAQAQMNNPIVNQSTCEIFRKEVNILSITTSKELSLVTISFETEKPFPGAPAFFCNFDLGTKELLNATYSSGEFEGRSASYGSSDRTTGYSINELEEIQAKFVRRSGTIDKLISERIARFTTKSGPCIKGNQP